MKPVTITTRGDPGDPPILTITMNLDLVRDEAGNPIRLDPSEQFILVPMGAASAQDAENICKIYSSEYDGVRSQALNGGLSSNGLFAGLADADATESQGVGRVLSDTEKFFRVRPE